MDRIINKPIYYKLTSLFFCYLITSAASLHAAEYGAWSTPVNLGSIVNSASRDGCQYLSKDGLSLYVASDRDTGSDMDLYVAERNNVDEDFGAPQRLVNLNAAGKDDVCPALSHDGHVLFFASARTGGCGDRDLWMTRRQNANDNFGWNQPVHLGCVVNSTKVDQGPSYYEDSENNKFIYFSSNRPSNNPDFGGHDIYRMSLFDDGTPDESTVTLVAELSSMANDHRPFLRKDGLEVIFDSNRNGPATLNDIWTATRTSTDMPFSSPAVITSTVSEKNEVRAVLNWDGTKMYITSNRPGSLGSIDVWVSTRTKNPAK